MSPLVLVSLCCFAAALKGSIHHHLFGKTAKKQWMPPYLHALLQPRRCSNSKGSLDVHVDKFKIIYSYITQHQILTFTCFCRRSALKMIHMMTFGWPTCSSHQSSYATVTHIPAKIKKTKEKSLFLLMSRVSRYNFAVFFLCYFVVLPVNGSGYVMFNVLARWYRYGLISFLCFFS